MNKLILFNKSSLKDALNKRNGETKFGEHVRMLPSSENIYEQLKDLDVDFVFFGIPEDIGVYANLGRRGAANTWSDFLKVLLNLQSNGFTKAKRTLILGHIDVSEELTALSQLNGTTSNDLKKARQLVSNIDTYVTQVVHDIIKAGKTPIIIGGGHNNAYGNIKGTSLALNQKINVINWDAHTDLRKEEGRHSGNVFT